MSLVRSALWQEAPSTEGFPLDEPSWHHLHFLAVKQTVHGIVYDAICQLPEELLPPADLLIHWMHEVQGIEANYQQQLRALAWLTTRIEAESALHPIILKGLPLAALYPTPSHRVSGDIDIFYGSAEAAETADSLVESWGTIVTRGKFGESVFTISHVPIEHHGYLVHSHVPVRKQRVTAWIEKRMKDADATLQVSIADMPVSVLTPTLDLIQLSSHSLGHALNEGVSVRQMCDLAIFAHHHYDTLSAAPLRQLLNRFGLRRWTDLCLSYCTTYLGLPTNRLPYPVKPHHPMLAAMHREVMLSGNFGHMDDRYERTPDGNSAVTAQRISRNVWRYLRVAPLESTSMLSTLTTLWLKDRIFGKEEQPQQP